MDYRPDCLHFRGHVPCRPHKEHGVHCDGCPHLRRRRGRILLIKLGAAGDVIRTTPLLEPLGKEYPDHALTWITDFLVSKDNAYPISRGGRARWRIENETLNTLKNQGYHFEHNYGHGHQYLATIFSMLMMLAFLVDQIQAFCCPLFQQAHYTQHSKIGLWEKMRSFFRSFYIESWEVFFLTIIKGQGRHDLIPDTS